MHEPHGYELPHADVVTRALSVPTIVTGRITTLAEAESILASGIADLVSMVRATIADPDLVTKSLAGDETLVRPCIGCNQSCVGGIFGAGGTVGCAVNADAGHESVATPPTRVASPRTVLVVGAGPAGLEAARVSALRGHRVLLREAAAAPGGLTAIARRAPYRAEFGAICDWLAGECTRLGVDVAYDTPVDRALVDELGPDAVIVATGSTFRRDGLQRWRPALEIRGLDLPHVVTPVEVLTGRASGRAALVLDDLGTYPAVGTSEYLLLAGTSVVFATSFSMFAPELVPSMQAEPALGRLHGGGAEILTRVVLEAVTPDRAHLRHLDSGIAREVACDLVVLATGFEAQRSLVDELAGSATEVHLVGDARSPRGLPTAIAEANALARAL
jgi:NADPH-dependent 2,4-dienoyl-CoA reductase/sulfur reductase-like enzyme